MPPALLPLCKRLSAYLIYTGPENADTQISVKQRGTMTLRGRRKQGTDSIRALRVVQKTKLDHLIF